MALVTLLNVHETASMLGVKVSTIYQWVHLRKIPFIKLGGSVRFRSSDIEQWIEGKTIHPGARPLSQRVGATNQASPILATEANVKRIVSRAKKEVLGEL